MKNLEGFDGRFPRIYRALKAVGHSPAKAVQILIDASRGDVDAMLWIRAVRSWR